MILDRGGPRRKHRSHTSKRIFERLREEHGFTGGITIVKGYVALCRQRSQEMFVPLVHPPGHAQADFGEAIGIIGGVERKIHFLASDLPHSDACFVVAYPTETTEAFCDGHVRAFTFFSPAYRSDAHHSRRSRSRLRALSCRCQRTHLRRTRRSHSRRAALSFAGQINFFEEAHWEHQS
jgi:hypothetical protein